jgi:HD domain
LTENDATGAPLPLSQHQRVTAEHPQSGRERLVLLPPVAILGTGLPDTEKAMMGSLSEQRVFMMGHNPALPRMPAAPRLLDFFRLRFTRITGQHLLQSARTALAAGQDEKVVIACLLHDISNAGLLRADHGYWGAQLVSPYVCEEVAWAIRYHQALRYFADESVGFKYPDAYNRFFGSDYEPPEYIRQAHQEARAHKWYMTSRLITIYDIYAFKENEYVDPEEFTDIIGRNFKQPREGLGFDGSPTAHMWRTMIWPNNFL